MVKNTISFDDEENKKFPKRNFVSSKSENFEDEDNNYDPFLEQREPLKSKVKFEEEEADLSDIDEDDDEEPSEFEEDEQEAEIQSKRRALKKVFKKDIPIDVPKKKSSIKLPSSSEVAYFSAETNREKEMKLKEFESKKLELELLKAQIELKKMEESQRTFFIPEEESDEKKADRMVRKVIQEEMLKIALKKESESEEEQKEEIIRPQKVIDYPRARPVNKSEVFVPEKRGWFMTILAWFIVVMSYIFFGLFPFVLMAYYNFILWLNIILSLLSLIIFGTLVLYFMILRKSKDFIVQLPINNIVQEPIRPVNEHQLKENEDFIDLKRCPKCNSKLHKGKVVVRGDNISQTYKCKSKVCDYFKIINLRK